MEEQIKQRAFILPRDKEIMEAIIKAACEHYDISEDVLMTVTKKPEATSIRHECMYLIISNTGLKDYAVADRFGITRTPLKRGVEIIETHRTIYRQTLDNLNAIVAIANNFEKKYQWQISL
jgi:chromosomal replication initiation ATPase DnaA